MITAPIPINANRRVRGAGTKPPVILYIATTRHYGGLELASIRLAELLMRTNPDHQRIIFGCRPGQFVEQHCREVGVPTAPLVIRNSGDIAGVDRLIKIIVDRQVDVVHVHSRRDYVIAVLAKAKLRRQRLCKAPRLVLHMHLMRPLGSPSMLSGYFFAPHVDRFVAVSGAVRDYLLKRHKQIGADQISVVPNSVDADSFKFDPIKGQAVRRKYGIPADAVVAGMVGRLDTKGQIEAISALGNLKRENVYLILIGDAGRNGYLRRLEKHARSQGVSRYVIFCGAQQDVAAYMSAMDIFVHLPRDEAFGLAPAEAMSCGLPVLSSNVGGCVELVVDGVTGLLADPKDRNHVRAQLGALIDSPELRERLSAAGCDYVRSRFTTKAQAEALMNMYDDILAVDPLG